MKTLYIVFCDDGKTVEHQLTDPEIARYLKVNDLNTGDILKTCGPHIVNRQFFYRGTAASLDSEQLPDGGVQQLPVGGHPWTTMLPNTNWSLSSAMMPTQNSIYSKSAQNHRNLPLPPLLHSLWIWANQTFVWRFRVCLLARLVRLLSRQDTSEEKFRATK